MSASVPTAASARAVTLDYFVEGMDCPSCVRKIEGAVGRLPGTSGARLNPNTQILRLTLNEALTSRATLEGRLRALGYPPRPLGGNGNNERRPWFATLQGRLVLLTGALLALAFALGLFAPGLAPPGYALATLIGVLPLARAAWAGVRAGNPFGIHTLVSVAALGALVIGEAAEAAVVVFLFALGELLEGVAAGKARAGIRALVALTPKTARLVQGGKTREVPAEALRAGQLVRVLPGERLPADGEIVDGEASVDDSPVTGESLPVYKGAGAAVFAGSVSTDGALTVRVTHEASDNTLARIIHMVEQAEAGKAPTARFIDRFSRLYTPLVFLGALLVATVPPLFGAPLHEWTYKALALLLIGCPCALVLSVPAAITSALSAGARHGLLVKGGAALEALAHVRTVAFDKTGTLTAGAPRVTEVVPFVFGEAQVLRLAAAVEQHSAHPLARAIVKACAEALPPASGARALSGRAVLATVAGRALAVGSPRFAGEQGALSVEQQARIETLEEEGHTVVVLLEGAAALGLIALRDEPRADARRAVAELRALGVESVMLTGDNARAAQAVADTLGLAAHAGLLPQDKLARLTDLPGPVAMVGDGINDAPALARADVGIAMGSGTDVALESAHAALLRPSVAGVPALVRLARATLSNIRVNVALALSLKAVFLITTLLGITGLWPAVLSDTGATALVTASALRLLTFDPHARRLQ